MTDTSTTPRRLRLDDLPEFSRPVGLHGRMGLVEVGASVCFGAIVAIVARP